MVFIAEFYCMSVDEREKENENVWYCPVIKMKKKQNKNNRKYSKPSMARTSFGPWTFIRGMGSSSHWELNMAPGQEANGDNLGKSFWYFIQ